MNNKKWLDLGGKIEFNPHRKSNNVYFSKKIA